MEPMFLVGYDVSEDKIKDYFSDKNIEPKNYLSTIEASFNSCTQMVKFYTLIIDDKEIIFSSIYRSYTIPLETDITRRINYLSNTLDYYVDKLQLKDLEKYIIG